MRAVMTTPATTAQAMSRPALDPWPRHGNEKDDQRERNRDASNVEHVAKRVVR